MKSDWLHLQSYHGTTRPAADTKVSANASTYGLEAVLLQHQDGEWKPVVYASRSKTETEMRYKQIEKEALTM